MGIIEQATLEFHEDLIVTSIYNNLAKKLQQPIVDTVLESIVIRRKNGWNVPDINSSLSKIDTPVFEGPDIKSCIMRQATDLLEGPKCWQAMELYPRKAIASLDTTMINKGRAVYVHFVGALLIASLMLQSWIRYHRLPGGLYYTYDKERLKRRREQVRMALNDEYLCRVQEHHATKQLGKERAREVLDTLKNAANREADLPSDYQYSLHFFRMFKSHLASQARDNCHVEGHPQNLVYEEFKMEMKLLNFKTISNNQGGCSALGVNIS